MRFGKHRLPALGVEIVGDMENRVAFEPRAQANYAPFEISDFEERRGFAKRKAEMVAGRQLDCMLAPCGHRMCWMKASHDSG